MTERQNNGDLRLFSLKMLPIRQAFEVPSMDDHNILADAASS
jgi:hypothetical protein